MSIGQTIFIHKMCHEIVEATRYFHFIIDENDAVYWISFSDSEYNSTSIFSRTIRPGMEDFFVFFSFKKNYSKREDTVILTM